MEDFESEGLPMLLQHLDDIYDSLSSGESDDPCQLERDVALVKAQSEKLPLQVIGDPWQTRLTYKRKTRKEILGPLPYSTELQRRKKAEIHALRLEAHQLSTRLAHIVKKSDESRAEEAIKELPEVQQRRRLWYSRAMDECEARSSAEHTNKELKAVLLQNFKAFRSIRKELKGKNVLKGLEFVDQPSPTVHHPLCQFDSRRSIFEELSSILDTLYLGSDVLLPPSSDNISVRCQRKLREAGEHFMEITSNTPLACPVHEAGQFLWNFITEGGDMDNENSLIIAGARPAEDCDTTRERRFKMQVFVRDTKNVLRCVEVIRMFRKYTDENRFVVVGTTRWLLPTEELELEDTYWTVISPSSTTNPTYSSGVQFYYQLQVISAGTMPENEKDALTHYIGNMARCDAQSMQGALLSTVGLS